jgi:hypothetical protein
MKDLTKEKITLENCRKLSLKQNLYGDIEQQARCWNIVFDYCLQNGMPSFPEDAGLSGIQKVIKFLQQPNKQTEK